MATRAEPKGTEFESRWDTASDPVALGMWRTSSCAAAGEAGQGGGGVAKPWALDAQPQGPRSAAPRPHTAYRCRATRTPPPCARTAAVPKVQADQRFNAHPRAKTSPCPRARHTRQQSAVRDGHAGSSHIRRGRTSPPNNRMALRCVVQAALESPALPSPPLPCTCAMT